MMALANQQGLRPQQMFLARPPPRLTEDPPADYAQADKANYYRLAANVERSNQFIDLAKILSISPHQRDRSYGAIVLAAFHKWIERVKLFVVQSLSFSVTRAASTVPTLLEEPSARRNDVSYYWEKLSESAELKLKYQTGEQLEPVWAAGDPNASNMMKARYIWELLQEWSREWKEEGSMLEQAYISRKGRIDYAESGSPPFEIVETAMLPRSGGE
jgi:hypothetical protein